VTEAPKPLVWLGGAALLIAAALDLVAVIGRHSGFPLHGSIELVQAALLVAGSVALITATVAQSHARVHLLLDRVKGRSHDLISRAGDLLSALFFFGLLCGNLWIAWDLWGGHEVSEIIGVPYAVLRTCATLGLAGVSLIFASHALGRAVK
jgi:TRAP-type C4-dicarboxylate transport system permease small subunit